VDLRVRSEYLFFNGISVANLSEISFQLQRNAVNILLGEPSSGKSALVVGGVHEVLRKKLRLGFTAEFNSRLNSAQNNIATYHAQCAEISAVVPSILTESIAETQASAMTLIEFLGLLPSLIEVFSVGASIVEKSSGKVWRPAAPEKVLQKLDLTSARKGFELCLVGAFFPRELFAAASNPPEYLSAFLASYVQLGFRRFLIGDGLVKFDQENFNSEVEEINSLLFSLSSAARCPGIVVVSDTFTAVELEANPSRLQKGLEDSIDISGSLSAFVGMQEREVVAMEYACHGLLCQQTWEVEQKVTQKELAAYLKSKRVTELRAGKDLLVNDIRLEALLNSSFRECKSFFLSAPQQIAAQASVENLQRVLTIITDAGLDHLEISQPLSSLSSGERRKLGLVSHLVSELTETLFITDVQDQTFPATHSSEIFDLLTLLKSQGNTVLITQRRASGVLNHSAFSEADCFIELVSEEEGSQVCYPTHAELRKRNDFVPKGLAEEVLVKSNSRSEVITAEINWPWCDARTKRSKKRETLKVGLRNSVALLGGIASGKTFLLRELGKLLEHSKPKIQISYLPHISDEQLDFSQTLADALELDLEIAKIFSTQALARQLSLSKESFVLFDKKGSCVLCQGKGYFESLELSDGVIRELCPGCFGQRFTSQVLRVSYQNLNVNELLSESVNAALSVFARHENVARVLQTLVSLGLGNLKLDSALQTMSFAERVKLRIAKIVFSRPRAEQAFFVEGLFAGMLHEEINFSAEIINDWVQAGNSIFYSTYSSQEAFFATEVVDLRENEPR